MIRYILLLLLLLPVLPLQGQQTVGLFVNDSLAQNGYTLIAPGSSSRTYLLDNCGRVVKIWQSSYAPGMVAYLLENGNLLRAARYPGNYSGGGVGGRIEMFDWDGNLLWGYNHATVAYHAHHDIEYLPNGNILLIAWEGHSRSEAIAQGRNPALTPNAGVWYEQIVEIEPVGTNQANIVWEWHLIDHLVQDFDISKPNYGVVSEHPELLDINYGATSGGNPNTGQDWAHFNAIDYNPELDQIVVSSRAMNEFYVIDHSTTTTEAAGHSGGNSGRGGDFLYRWGNPEAYNRGGNADQRLWGQHDVHWIEPGKPDAGKIMLFNNGQGRPGGNYSSVDVLTPPLAPDKKSYVLNPGMAFGPTGLDWTYFSPQPNSFYSPNISGAQRQPNGNTLICEGALGHLFEVDHDGNMHWDYVNPVSGMNPVSQGANPIQNSLFRAYRYTPDYPGLIGRDLTPGAPLELNPLPSDCKIFDGTVSQNEIPDPNFVRAFPNPVSGILNFENPSGNPLAVQLTDPAGRQLRTQNFENSEFQLDLTGFAEGLYFLQIIDLKTRQFTALKIIKQ